MVKNLTSDNLNPSDKVQSDKDIYELVKKINPTNYQDSSKVYLIKDVINNITSVLPIFLSRSLIMQQATLDEKSDWNNLQPNSMQVFLSTSGLNAPDLASTNNTGIVFTFNLKTDEINKMYQLAFSVGDNISFAVRGKDIDLDGAEWHYTPNVVDYDTFKGAVNAKLDDMYSKFVTGMDAYKPENLEPIIEKADKMVQDATNNAQISVDGFKVDITQKVNDTLAQLKTVQDSANKLQSQVTDFSNQKIQEINNKYDSQLKDLEKTYVADVQSYITQVNKAQATLDSINKTVSSLDVSKLIDLSDYYTKEDVNKVIANTLSGYITSTAVDTKISNAISPLQTQVNNSAVGTNLLTGTSSDLKTEQLTNEWNVGPQATNGRFEVKVVKGQKYTYRAWIDNTNGPDDAFVNIRLFPTTEGGRDYSVGEGTPINKGETGYSTFVFTPTEDGYIQLIPCAYNVAATTLAGWKEEKLENGSVATDWCPNPDDKVNIADMRKPASDVAGIEEVNAKADTSAVDQLKTDLTSQVSILQTQVDNSAVGTNLLLGTSGSFTMWYGSLTTVWNADKKRSEISLPTTVSVGEILPQNPGFFLNVTPGIPYTQSIYVSTDAPLTGKAMQVSWFTNTYGHNTSGKDNISSISKNVYRITSTQTWPASSTDSNIRAFYLFNLGAVFDFTKGTFLYFYQPKFELGSHATDWCPNPSEILTKGETVPTGSQGDTGGTVVKEVTQAEYDALTTKDPNTIYYIWLS